MTKFNVLYKGNIQKLKNTEKKKKEEEEDI